MKGGGDEEVSARVLRLCCPRWQRYNERENSIAIRTILLMHSERRITLLSHHLAGRCRCVRRVGSAVESGKTLVRVAEQGQTTVIVFLPGLKPRGGRMENMVWTDGPESAEHGRVPQPKPVPLCKSAGVEIRVRGVLCSAAVSHEEAWTGARTPAESSDARDRHVGSGADLQFLGLFTIER